MVKKVENHPPPSLKAAKEEQNGDTVVKRFGENWETRDGEQMSSQVAGGIEA